MGDKLNHHHPRLEDVRIAIEVGADFIINSDAHFYDTVGKWVRFLVS